MTAVPFPPSTAPGRLEQSGGRLINLYGEKASDGRVLFRRVPGLRKLVEATGETSCRGMIEINGVVLIAFPDAIYSVVQSSGTYTVTELGSLPGTEPVRFARNNKQPTPDIVAVTGGSAYECYIDTAPIAYSDSDVGGPNDVAFLQGYFVFSYGNAMLMASGLNDTTINTLDYTYAESRPDGLLRVLAFADNIVALGPSSIEIYRNTGEAAGFPLSLLGTVPRGLLAAGAVAGQDAGFSNQLLFVGDDRVVYRLDGTSPVRVSTHEIERQLQALVDPSGLTACVYMHSGHACWALSGDAWTYVYDLTAGVWHERESRNLGRWRASHTVKAFDQWICGVTDGGSVFAIDENFHLEGTEEINAVAISAGMTAFPKGASAYSFAIDMVTSAGTSSGSSATITDPVATLSWSTTGGASFGTRLIRTMAKEGEYNKRMTASRLGLARAKSLVVKVECSDPVPFVLYGGDLTASPRA